MILLCAYIFVSTAFYTLCLSWLKYSTLPPFVSTRLNTNPVYVHKSLHFFATDIWIQPHQHNRHQKCRVPVCRNIQIEKENVKQQIAKRSL